MLGMESCGILAGSVRGSAPRGGYALLRAHGGHTSSPPLRRGNKGVGHCERSHERAAIERVGLPRIVDCFARAARSQGRGAIVPLLCMES